MSNQENQSRVEFNIADITSRMKSSLTEQGYSLVDRKELRRNDVLEQTAYDIYAPGGSRIGYVIVFKAYGEKGIEWRDEESHMAASQNRPSGYREEDFTFGLKQILQQNENLKHTKQKL